MASEQDEEGSTTKILVYQSLFSFISEACRPNGSRRISPAAAEVQAKLNGRLLSMSQSSEDIVSAVISSLEWRKVLFKLSSDLGLSESDDHSLRTAIRKDEEQLAAHLLSIIDSQSATATVLSLKGELAQCFLDVAQDVLDRGFLMGREHAVQRIIRRLSSTSCTLPSSLFITGVTGREAHPTFGGGFGDIYRASYKSRTVALKHIRNFHRGLELRRTRSILFREALVWRDLKHPNILPFLGIDQETFPSDFCMVSPWMENGTVLSFLNAHGRTRVDKLLHEIAQGLEYLHSHNIVHGDLRGANILITQDWQACLADFTLSKFSDVTASTRSSAIRGGGSSRWMAPELIVPDQFDHVFVRTPASDVYAFGCVCIELYTGRPPFSGLLAVAAALRVVTGERPERPSAMSDGLWRHVTSCWEQDPAARPAIQTIVHDMDSIRRSAPNSNDGDGSGNDRKDKIAGAGMSADELENRKSIPDLSTQELAALSDEGSNKSMSLWQQAFDSLDDKHKEYLRFVLDIGSIDLASILKLASEKKRSWPNRWLSKLYKMKSGEEVTLPDILDNLSPWIESFTQNADMNTQFNKSSHAAIPWIIVKALLQLTIKSFTASGSLIESLGRILRIIAVYSEPKMAIETSRANQFSASLLRLYAVVLTFLADAHAYYSGHSSVRFAVDDSMHFIEKLEQEVYREQNLLNDDRLQEIIYNGDEQTQIIHYQAVHIDEQTKRFEAPTEQIDCDYIWTEDAYNTALRYRHVGTCTWVLKLEELRAWESRDAARPKLLWMHGPPGIGKTVLSATITQHLKQTTGNLVAYFFCTAEDRSTNDPYIILRSWLTQALQDPQIFDAIHSHLSTRMKGNVLTHGELWDLFVLIGNSVPGCIFVVDGFDECTNFHVGAGSLVHSPRSDFLRDLMKHLPKTRSRILAVSRDASDIRAHLGQESFEADMFEYRIAVDDTAADIKSFSEAMVDQKLRGRTADLRQNVAVQVIERSEGVFLWVKLLEHELSPGQKKKELVATVSETPSGISGVYGRDLERVMQLPHKHKEQAFTILRWVMFAIRPLNVKELVEALFISDEDLEEYPRDDLPDLGKGGSIDEDYVKEMIIGRCGSLLQLRSSSRHSPVASHTVHLVHFSLKEYLLQPNSSVPNLPFFDPAAEEARLSKICLRYLTLDVFKTIPSDAKLYPFLGYASWAWYYHAQLTPTDKVMERAVREVFDPDTSNWRIWAPILEEVWIRERWEGFDYPASGIFVDDNLACAQNPLYYACLLGLLDVVEWLAKYNEQDINCAGGYFQSPLHAAVAGGHRNVVTYLLNGNVAEKQTKHEFGAALAIATAVATPEIVHVLLDAGADINTELNGRTPLEHAILRQAAEIAENLHDRGAVVTPEAKRLNVECRLFMLLEDDGEDDASSVVSTIWEDLDATDAAIESLPDTDTAPMVDDNIREKDPRGPASDILTFVIYPPVRRKGPLFRTRPTLSPEDIEILGDELTNGGATVTVHSPDVVIQWLEAHYDKPFIQSFRQYGIGGPIAAMLSPDDPTLVIFGSILDCQVLKAAQQLARKSGFLVMVRPLRDNPLPRWISRVSTTEDGPTNGSRPGEGTDNSIASDSESSVVPDSDDSEKEDLEEEVNPVENNLAVQILEDSKDHSPKSSPPHKAWRLRGGVSDRNFTDPWTSKLYRIPVHLKIFPAAELEYFITLRTKMKFTVQSLHDPDKRDATRPHFRSWTQFSVIPRGTRDVETDRSYSNITFLIKGKRIAEAEEVYCEGFTPPQEIEKNITGKSTQKGGILNLTSPHTAGVTGIWNQTTNETRELQNSGPTPKVWLRYNPCKPLEYEGFSSESFDVAYEAKDKFGKEGEGTRDPLKAEFAMEVCLVDTDNPSFGEVDQASFLIRNQTNLWISNSFLKARAVGILVLTTAYVSEVRTEAPNDFFIEEKQSVHLDGHKLTKIQAPVTQLDPEKTVQTALSLGVVPKPRNPGNLRGVVQKISDLSKLFGGERVESQDLPLYEYIARGWDAVEKQWRMPVYPSLSSTLRQTSKGDAAWELTVRDSTDKGKKKQSDPESVQLPLPVNPTANIDAGPSVTGRTSETTSTTSESASLPTTNLTSLTSLPDGNNAAADVKGKGKAVAGPSKVRE